MLATFVCGDRVTDLLQPAFESALSDGLGHSGSFDRFRYEWRLFQSQLEQESKEVDTKGVRKAQSNRCLPSNREEWK